MEEAEAAAAAQIDQSTDTESVITQPDLNLPSTCPESTPDELGRTELKLDSNQNEIFKALEVLERDSLAIAESFTSLFASLRFALSEATSTSVDHMQCFGDAAGCLQESVLDAATKGNRYINSCLRLNEEMKGIDTLATQLFLSWYGSKLTAKWVLFLCDPQGLYTDLYTQEINIATYRLKFVYKCSITHKFACFLRSWVVFGFLMFEKKNLEEKRRYSGHGREQTAPFSMIS